MSAKLGTMGTNIIDGAGNPVRLISTNTDHNEYSKGYFTTEDVVRMQSHGGNCVELNGLRVARMMPSRGNIDPTYLTNLDGYLNTCENARQYVIFTFDDMSYETWDSTMPNWMLDGHGYGSAPYSEDTVDSALLDFYDTNITKQNDNRQSYIDMWVYLANRYRDKQYVMFGIANEPFSHCDRFITARGGSTYSAHLGVTYASFMSQLIDAVHAVSNNLIFIDRPYCWYLSDIQPIFRDGIVWEDHAYVNVDTPADITRWKNEVNLRISRFMGNFAKPFYLGEYGPYPTNMTGWQNVFSQQVAFLQNSPLSGYAWHSWGVLNSEVYGETTSGFSASDSETLLNIVYSLVKKKYIFAQWGDGIIDNPRTVIV